MSDLKASIGPWRGTFMMLNIVLGAGLLTLPGLAAQVAGPAAPIVWLACAAASVPLLAVFAVLGREYPSSGGIPAWVKQAFGDLAYVPSIFLFLGAVGVGLPSIAITGGQYVASVFNGDAFLYAALLIVAATVANLASPDVAGRINAFIASTLLIVLVALAVIGWRAVDPMSNAAITWAPDLSVSTFGFSFVMIFFAFTGWEVAANLGGEFKNARRNVPIAIFVSFVAATALYFCLALVVAGAGPRAAVAAPFAIIFGDIFGAVGAQVVAVVAVLLIFANLSAAIWAVSRLVFSISRDGVLPRLLGHTTNGVPLRAVILTTSVLLGVTALSRGGLVNLNGLLAAAGLNFLLLYAAAACVLIALSQQTAHRVLALVGIAIVALLALSQSVEALQYPFVLILLGLAFALFRRRSARSLPAAH